MTIEDRCPTCGDDTQYTDVMMFGRIEPVNRIWRCCPRPPTAQQMAATADREWLDRQRRLAEDR